MLKKFFLKIFEKISSSFFFYFFLAFILFHVLIQLFIFLPNIFYSFLFFFERVINILDYLYLYFKFDYIDTFVENICWGNFYYTLVIENFLWDITEIYTPHALYIKAKCEMFYFGYFFYFFFTPYILAIILSNIIFFVFLETSTFSIFFFLHLLFFGTISCYFSLLYEKIHNSFFNNIFNNNDYRTRTDFMYEFFRNSFYSFVNFFYQRHFFNLKFYTDCFYFMITCHKKTKDSKSFIFTVSEVFIYLLSFLVWYISLMHSLIFIFYIYLFFHLLQFSFGVILCALTQVFCIHFFYSIFLFFNIRNKIIKFKKFYINCFLMQKINLLINNYYDISILQSYYANYYFKIFYFATSLFNLNSFEFILNYFFKFMVTIIYNCILNILEFFLSEIFCLYYSSKPLIKKRHLFDGIFKLRYVHIDAFEQYFQTGHGYIFSNYYREFSHNKFLNRFFIENKLKNLGFKIHISPVKFIINVLFKPFRFSFVLKKEKLRRLKQLNYLNNLEKLNWHSYNFNYIFNKNIKDFLKYNYFVNMQYYCKIISPLIRLGEIFLRKIESKYTFEIYSIYFRICFFFKTCSLIKSNNKNNVDNIIIVYTILGNKYIYIPKVVENYNYLLFWKNYDNNNVNFFTYLDEFSSQMLEWDEKFKYFKYLMFFFPKTTNRIFFYFKQKVILKNKNTILINNLENKNKNKIKFISIDDISFKLTNLILLKKKKFKFPLEFTNSELLIWAECLDYLKKKNI